MGYNKNHLPSLAGYVEPRMVGSYLWTICSLERVFEHMCFFRVHATPIAEVYAGFIEIDTEYHNYCLEEERDQTSESLDNWFESEIIFGEGEAF